MITKQLKEHIESLPKIKSKKFSTHVILSLSNEITFENHLDVLEFLLFRVKLLRRKIWFIDEYEATLSTKGVHLDIQSIAKRRQNRLQYKRSKEEEYKKTKALEKALTKQIKNVVVKGRTKAKQKSIKNAMKNLDVHQKAHSISGAYGSPGNHYRTISISPKS